MIDFDKMTALVNWLVAGAPPKRSFNDLVKEIGQRLTGTGLPVHQLGLYQMLIHPEAPGRFNYWTEKGGAHQAAGSGAISSLQDIRQQLLAAAREDLQFRASLHPGDIHYGNIGSKSRLDFTAIGPSVNLAARLMAVADELGRDFVCSDVFHHLVPQRTDLLGERMFKGFEHPHKVYGITG